MQSESYEMQLSRNSKSAIPYTEIQYLCDIYKLVDGS